MNRPVVGAVAWLSVAQFFVVEVLVARSSTAPYSRRANYVSDLGSPTCGPYFDRVICSPDHVWMNVSFGLVGVAIILGAWLLRASEPELLPAPLVLIYVVGALGAVVVAVFPLTTVRPLHAAGGALLLVASNLGHVVLGRRLLRRGARWFGVGLLVVGVAGVVCAPLVAAGSTLGVGVGFVQRVAVYGSLVGTVASGLVMLRRSRR